MANSTLRRAGAPECATATHSRTPLRQAGCLGAGVGDDQAVRPGRREKPVVPLAAAPT